MTSDISNEKIVRDQIGKLQRIPASPQRIISLVPSQTELLFDLGVGNRVVGITKFCVHPAEQVNAVIKIGGTKKFNFDVIDQLKPDLIIANKEENYKEGIEKLREKYPVWTSDISTLEDAFDMMIAVGGMTQSTSQANELVAEIKNEFTKLQALESKRALYLIWRDPYMSVGTDTFIHCMMETTGFENVLNRF